MVGEEIHAGEGPDGRYVCDLAALGSIDGRKVGYKFKKINKNM